MSSINAFTPHYIITNTWNTWRRNKDSDSQELFFSSVFDNIIKNDEPHPQWFYMLDADTEWGYALRTFFCDKLENIYDNIFRSDSEHNKKFKDPTIPTSKLAAHIAQMDYKHSSRLYGLAAILEIKHFDVFRKIKGSYTPLSTLIFELMHFEHLTHQQQHYYFNMPSAEWDALVQQLSPRDLSDIYYHFIYDLTNSMDHSVVCLKNNLLTSMRHLPLATWLQCLTGETPNSDIKVSEMVAVSHIRELANAAYDVTCYQMKNSYANLGLHPFIEMALWYHINERTYLMKNLIHDPNAYIQNIGTPIGKTLFSIHERHHQQAMSQQMTGDTTTIRLPTSGDIGMLPLLSWNIDIASINIKPEDCHEYISEMPIVF